MESSQRAGKTLSFRQRMELNGALSNPVSSTRTPLERLGKLVRELTGRHPDRHQASVPPRQRPPIRAAVEAVVQAASEPMRIVDVSRIRGFGPSACVQGSDVFYSDRAL